MIELNDKQTPFEVLGLDNCSRYVQDNFYDFFYNVPFIRSLTRKDRPRAKDLPRDEYGKIIIDLENPHILEDMEYFRKAGRYYMEHGVYTDLRPNKNPNSEYYKWAIEEVRRCFNGMVRPSDGEWIPGDLYFFWNYTEMQVAVKDKKNKNSNKALRVYRMPDTWDGHYFLYHYLEQTRNKGLHACMLSSRGRGKSFTGAALLAKRFVLGESFKNQSGVTCYATASDKKYLVAGDQTLDKFQHNIDFLAKNTEWPHDRLANRLIDMQWIAGYKDNDKLSHGSGNSVIGISSADDEQKLRGTRAVLYIIEEGGTFARLLRVWSNCLPSVEQGQGEDRDVFGMLFMYGTSGDKESDFAAMATIMYNPKAYNVHYLKNIYDLEGKGGPIFSYFFPSYMNNAGCYDKDGNSDVTKALLAIIKDRDRVRSNTTDLNAVTKLTAEYPIVPQEAIIKARNNVFPIAEINERITQLDSDPHSFDDVYVGKLVQKIDGGIEFKITNDEPIREFPLKDNKVKGAVEIYMMPEIGRDGKAMANRYILSCDPVDHDQADSLSLSSTFVFDLFTDRIVAEYTGRNDFAEENYEVTRKLCLFYNGTCLYENNIRGMYAYFSKMRNVYLLADTPPYLKDRDIVKNVGVGNGSKGVGATTPVNDFANRLIRDWLLTPKTVVENDTEVSLQNLYFLKNRALLRELSCFSSGLNVDRVRSLGLLMIYREHFMIQYEGDVKGNQKPEKTLLDDPFFKRNSPFRHDDNDEKGTFKPL